LAVSSYVDSHRLKIYLNVCFSEPTNMLDMKAVIWLETYLQVIVVRIMKTALRGDANTAHWL